MALLDFDPDGEEKVLVAACFSPPRLFASARRRGGSACSGTTTGSRCCAPTWAIGGIAGTGPGAAFERTDYRFELVTDYGAFRDLQRHRMLTIEWQRLGVSLGYDMPDLVAESGLGDRYDEAIARAEELYRSLAAGLSRAGVLRRRAGASHSLRHAVQRTRGDAPHRAALRHRRVTPPTGGWPSRCTARSPRSPATAPSPRR